MKATLTKVALAALAAVEACHYDPHLVDGRIECNFGRCPSGYLCANNYCYSKGKEPVAGNSDTAVPGGSGGNGATGGGALAGTRGGAGGVSGTGGGTPVACAANQLPIAADAFSMGSADGYANEKPVHQVTLSAYCMDKTEVTVAEYRACVTAGGCKEAGTDDSGCNWAKSDVDQHPINCVDWTMADAYCKWAGGQLPTEAQWEFAARGTDGRTYPWGKDPPSAELLNWNSSATLPVSSYPRGASPFGLLDMAGNVSEWTADAYESYSAQSEVDPRRIGDSASSRVYRGGGWFIDVPSGVRAANRNWGGAADRLNSLGFRCARGAKM